MSISINFQINKLSDTFLDDAKGIKISLMNIYFHNIIYLETFLDDGINKFLDTFFDDATNISENICGGCYREYMFLRYKRRFIQGILMPNPWNCLPGSWT